MNVVRFLARDTADAIAQVRSRLGPEAVWVGLRQVPAGGLSRLWRRPLLEVRAALPDNAPGAQQAAKPSAGIALLPVAPSAGASPSSRYSEPTPAAQQQPLLRRHKRGTTKAGPPGSKRPRARVTRRERRHSGSEPAATPSPETSNVPVTAPVTDAAADGGPPGLGGRWRSGAVLQQLGLQPILVEKVLERARSKHGEEPPAVFADEMALTRTALASFWRAASEVEGRSPQIHAFIGPPGSGKTTVLCKWLAKSVLTERRPARVWRLDSRAANFGGLLDFYAEVLGVQVEREWKGAAGLAGCQGAFVDLPGVNLQDATAVEQLQAQLVALAGAQTHLVLNAAYEVPVLLAQARAFDDWPVSDLILTHLDEEKRLGKLWNFLLGTKFSVGFLSGGQNVPGEFSAATPELLIPQ